MNIGRPVKDPVIRAINRKCVRNFLTVWGATEAEIDEACAVSDELPESVEIRAAVAYTVVKNRAEGRDDFE